MHRNERDREKRLIDVDHRWAIGTQRDARDTEKDGSQRIDEVARYINRHIVEDKENSEGLVTHSRSNTEELQASDTRTMTLALEFWTTPLDF